MKRRTPLLLAVMVLLVGACTSEALDNAAEAVEDFAEEANRDVVDDPSVGDGDRSTFPSEEEDLGAGEETSGSEAAKAEPDGIAVISQSLVGGEYVVDQADFPFVVRVLGCTGTAIEPRVVLTAAHCFDDFDLSWPNALPQVRTGLPPDAGLGVSDSRSWIQSYDVVIHPDYEPSESALDEGRFNHDVALVFVDTDLPGTVQTVAAGRTLPNSPEGLVLGFGAVRGQDRASAEPSRGLKAGAVPIHQDSDAADWLNAWYQLGLGSFDGEVHIAYGATDGGTRICFGDSGGPVLIDDVDSSTGNFAWTQVAVNSWTRGGCANAGVPDVGADLANSTINGWISGSSYRTRRTRLADIFEATNYNKGFGLSAGDFNGDGLHDLLVGATNQSEVVVYLLAPRGLEEARISPTWNGSRFGWRIGDFDGDQCDDLAGSDGDPGFTVYLSDCRGSFYGSLTNLAADNQGSADSFVVGDFDGDGCHDMLQADDVYDSYNGGAVVSVSNCDGTFQVPVVWNETTYYGARQVATAASWNVGDFNGDGCDDLIRSASPEFLAEIATSDCAGSFEPTDWSVDGEGAFSYLLGDFNGDRCTDIAWETNEWGGLAYSASDCRGSFVGITTVSTAGNWGGSWLPGDFNGDGITDLATTNSGSVEVLLTP